VAPGQAPLRNPHRGRRGGGEGPQVRPGKEPRFPGLEAARGRSRGSASRAAIRRARASSARSPT
jgi:hypothetical protein